MAHVWSEGAVAAVSAYLQNGTTGINATLATIRTEKSLTTANLPDIRVFEDYYHRASQAGSFPYLSVVWLGRSGEQDGANGRMYDHQLMVSIVVPENQITSTVSQQSGTALAAVRYSDAIARTFIRRVPKGSQGWTLSNTAGIVRAEVGAAQFGSDGELEYANLAVTNELSVRTEEDY